MNARKKTRKVCIALNIGGASGRAYMSGILRYVNEGRPWTIQFLQFSEHLPSTGFQNALNAGPDGLILRAPSPEIADLALRAEVLPVAFIDFPALLKTPRQGHAACVHLDHFAVGAMGADHLLSIGNFASFGYADVFVPSRWGADRGAAFAKAVRRTGRKVAIFRLGRNPDREDETARLRAWLSGLPKPAAIMASCDYSAVRVIEACTELGLSIPEQVAVVGVDNDEILCLSVRPSLSSISPGHEEVGYRAAAELDRMMRGLPVRNDVTVKGGGTVVVRDSTRAVPPAGALVTRALAFIEANAGHRLAVGDVVRHLGVSRRLADLRFRQVRKTSILDAISAVRMRKLKARLRTTDDPIRQIASDFGFSSPERLAHFFHRHAGQSMRDYRNSLK